MRGGNQAQAVPVAGSQLCLFMTGAQGHGGKQTLIKSKKKKKKP